MQCKYYQILLERTYEWSLWRGGRFIEVVFKTGSTVLIHQKSGESIFLEVIDSFVLLASTSLAALGTL